MSEKPRTWTLEKPPGIFDAVAVLKPREMRVGQKIKVIELEAVLDLLYEYVYGGTGRWLEPGVQWMIDLLREHGRLK